MHRRAFSRDIHHAGRRGAGRHSPSLSLSLSLSPSLDLQRRGVQGGAEEAALVRNRLFPRDQDRIGAVGGGERVYPESYITKYTSVRRYNGSRSSPQFAQPLRAGGTLEREFIDQKTSMITDEDPLQGLLFC